MRWIISGFLIWVGCSIKGHPLNIPEDHDVPYFAQCECHRKSYWIGP